MLPDADLQGKRTGWRRGVGIKGFTDICNHLHPGGRGTERLEKWSCHYANGSRRLKVTSHLPVRWHFEMLQFSILTLRDMICRHHMNHQEPSRDKHKKPVIPGEHILCRINSAGCNRSLVWQMICPYWKKQNSNKRQTCQFMTSTCHSDSHSKGRAGTLKSPRCPLGLQTHTPITSRDHLSGPKRITD